MPPTNSPQWLTTEDLCSRYNVALKTVYHWRTTRTGPVGTRIGKRILFALEDVEQWESDRRDRRSA